MDFGRSIFFLLAWIVDVIVVWAGTLLEKYLQFNISHPMHFEVIAKNIARIANAVQVTICKSLLLNVMIQVLQFVSNSQLRHYFTKLFSN